MDPNQIELVRQSFARASRFGPHLAATFYRELFAIDPSVKPLFRRDMVVQGEKLMNMLAQVVGGLSDLEAMLPILRALANAHVGYGVEERHYASVGIALLRALRHELGAEFTPEVRAAWAQGYGLLSQAMTQAAYRSDIARAG